VNQENFRHYYFVIATAHSPIQKNGTILQNGALYTLRGKLIPHSLRTSGISGDSFRNQNAQKLNFFKIIRILVGCIKARRFLLNNYYCGPWFYVFGHFLLETLTRIGLHENVKNHNLVFHTMDSSAHHQSVFPYQKRLIDLLGFKNSKIVLLTDHSFLLFNVKVLLPQVHFPTYISPLTPQVFQRITSCRKSSLDLGSKIFLSRSKLHPLHQRIPLGIIRELEILMQKSGFELLHPETLSVDDQISAISNAKYIAGPQGSALHLSVFGQPKIKVIEFGDELRTSTPNYFQKELCIQFDQELIFFPFDNELKSFNFIDLEAFLKSL
jgi:capsular polysaccharide biosynthesis protein